MNIVSVESRLSSEGLFFYSKYTALFCLINLSITLNLFVSEKSINLSHNCFGGLSLSLQSLTNTQFLQSTSKRLLTK